VVTLTTNIVKKQCVLLYSYSSNQDARVGGVWFMCARCKLTFSTISNYTQVIEVKSNGMVSTEKISRRQLLKSSGMQNQFISHAQSLSY
jgi:hypothetical protein